MPTVQALRSVLGALGLASLSIASSAAPAPALAMWPRAEDVEALDQPYRVAGALPVARYMAPAALQWEVRTQDITLSRTLERWAADAGYRVKWDAQRNILIGAADTYEGDFETALQLVLGSAGIRQSDYPLEACIYANTPPLVRITRQGEQARECNAP